MASTPLDARIARANRKRRFYTAVAIVAVLVVFGGFARTFFLKSAFGAPELTLLKIVHGIVMTAWFVLFALQSWLIESGRVRIHRRVGLGGIVLGGSVLILGTTLAIASARSGYAPLGATPLVFMAFPLMEMTLFATLFTTAILLRDRGAYHKRLMLIASLAMLTPAIARLPVDFIQRGGPPVFVGLTDVLIAACIAFDAIAHRKLHRASVVGFAVVVGVQVVTVALVHTDAWLAFGKWLIG